MASTNNVFNNIVIIDAMIPYLEFMTNRDLVSFISTCKANYKWKNRITFPISPSIKALTKYSNEKRLHHLPTTFRELVVTENDVTKSNGELYKSIASNYTHASFYYFDIQRCLSLIPQDSNRLTTLYLDNASSLGFPILPRTLLSLTLKRFAGVIHSDHLPPTLTHLSISGRIIEPLEVGSLPSTLQDIEFEGQYALKRYDTPNIISESVLPSSLRRLVFQFTLYPLDAKSLPLGLETLSLTTNYDNYNLAGIPPTVKTLTLDKVPTSIKAGIIPSSVTTLKMEFGGGKYSSHLDIIPNSVTNLEIFCNKTPTPPNIPTSVKYLTLSGTYSNNLNVYIPESVTHLTLNSSSPLVIPTSVTHLTFGDMVGMSTFPKGFIPESVTHLTFGIYQNFSSLDFIPSSVTHLDLGGYTPEAGKKVEEIANFKVMVPRLKHLVFHRYIPQLLSRDKDGKSVLPPSCTHIYLTGYSDYADFNKSVLPEHLEHIEFGYAFNQVIDQHVIPRSIKKICLLPKNQITLRSIRELHSSPSTTIFPLLQNNIIYLPTFSPSYW